MHIVAHKTLVDYYTLHPEAKTAIEEWHTKTKKAEWNNIADVKNTFRTADAVGNQRYVFNIKGNDFRLIAIIQFTPKRVFIRFVGTHAEYDKIKDASII